MIEHCIFGCGNGRALLYHTMSLLTIHERVRNNHTSESEEAREQRIPLVGGSVYS